MNFRVGALVIAVSGNSPEAKRRGGAPIGNTIRPGDAGEIIEGPTPYYYCGMPMTYWHVAWRDGRKTWSGQRFLLVIEPDALPVEQATEVTT